MFEAAGGHPLLIEIAAGHVASLGMSVADLLEDLRLSSQERLLLLEGVVAHAWEGLPGKARALPETLSGEPAVIVTNQKTPGDEVIRWYRERCGKSEEVHAIEKHDLAGGNGSCWAPTATGRWIQDEMSQLACRNTNQPVSWPGQNEHRLREASRPGRGVVSSGG